MMVIDMTYELAPILFGLNAALIVSAAAVASCTAMTTWFRAHIRFERRRFALHRPALAR